MAKKLETIENNMLSMARLTYLLFFSILSFGVLNAQNSLPLWFSEKFEDNTNRWNDVVEHGEQVRYNALFINPNKDYRILAEFDSRFADPYRASWGLSWGRKSQFEYLYFEINNQKEFRIGYRLNSRYNVVLDWKKAKNIETGYNKLEIHQIKGTLHFIINEKEVYKMPAMPFYNSEIALRSTDTKIEYKKLEIYQDMGSINVLPEVADYQTKKENLGEAINSTYIDKFPNISPDGQTLYFLREDYPGDYGGQDIWFATRNEDGSWNKAQNIGPQLNNKASNFVNSVMPDNNTLCIINSYGIGNADDILAFTHRTSTGWSYPTPIHIEQLQKLGRWLSFYLAADGRTLVFSMRRPDSYGGRDIYVSFMQSNGSFSIPKNLGPTINTTGNEHCPFLAADGKTLYFDTDGHPGYGGRDIFMSRRLDDSWTNWSVPENMGPGINTANSDEGIIIPASGEYAYFVSNEKSLGGLDIYRLKLPKELRPQPTALLRGRVTECSSPKGMEAIIRVYNEADEEVATARSHPSTGKYQLALAGGAVYTIKIEVNTALYNIPEKLIVDLSDLEIYKELTLDTPCAEDKEKKPAQPKVDTIPTKSPTKDTVVAVKEPTKETPIPSLPAVYFGFDKSFLTVEAVQDLNKALDVLKSQPNWKLEVIGHTDAQGSDLYNELLSERRVQSVVDYLLLKGLSKDRIIQRIAKGETEPADNNETALGRARNRRVEFKILP